jgi:phosphoribosylamine--glycine ligase
VVIEEFMHGEEASLFAICDGKTAVLFGAAQDHKRAYDGDTKGPTPAAWAPIRHRRS